MTKSSFKYVVIDDDLHVCESIKKRMNSHENWQCAGLIPALHEALQIIEKELPQLLFLDWAIKGGNAFTLLESIEKFKNYKPYIIFFTGYQSDHPEIPVELINRFEVNRYLVKPIFENLTNHLSEYVLDAENFYNAKNTSSELWITTFDKQKLKIIPKEIVCISQSRANPRNKIIHTEKGCEFEIKASWEICEKLAKTYNIDYIFANARDALINKNHILKFQKPFLYFNNGLKVEVTKEKWKDVENCI